MLEEEESDEVKILYTLQVSVIDILPNDIPQKGRIISLTEHDWDKYNPFLEHVKHLGDAWAQVAEYRLHLAQLLLGDTPWITQDWLKQCFYVVKVGNGPFYAIYDRHQLWRTEIHIEYLKDLYFWLMFWYANQLCLKFKIVDNNTNRDWSMGDALGENAMQILWSGITELYPTWNQEVYNNLQFTMVQNGVNSWDIHDDDYEGQPISISRSNLETPAFDICEWYAQCRPQPRVIVIRKKGFGHRET